MDTTTILPPRHTIDHAKCPILPTYNGIVTHRTLHARLGVIRSDLKFLRDNVEFARKLATFWVGSDPSLTINTRGREVELIERIIRYLFWPYARVIKDNVFHHSQGGSKVRCLNKCMRMANITAGVCRGGWYGDKPVWYYHSDDDSVAEICQICGNSGWTRNFYNSRFTIVKENAFYVRVEAMHALTETLPLDVIRVIIELML